MNIALATMLLVGGLVAGSLAGQTAGRGGIAIEDPDIAPPPTTLKQMWDVSPVVIVGRVLPPDAEKDGSRGVRDSRFFTYSVRPIDILKGSGLGDKLTVRVPVALTANRWAPGEEYLMFLKRTSARDTFDVTAASWWMLKAGGFEIPVVLREPYFGGRARIPKDELLVKLRQLR